MFSTQLIPAKEMRRVFKYYPVTYTFTNLHIQYKARISLHVLKLQHSDIRTHHCFLPKKDFKWKPAVNSGEMLCCKETSGFLKAIMLSAALRLP